MSYCGGLQYYCKLGATSQAVHICYVSRHTQHAQQFKNQQGLICLPRVTMALSHCPTSHAMASLVKLSMPR
uniref:Uncharacterized protein n=1 Tax=Apteryx owenii TaxID=8824 RepID=A0A8B9Q6Z9_APTOW